MGENVIHSQVATSYLQFFLLLSLSPPVFLVIFAEVFCYMV